AHGQIPWPNPPGLDEALGRFLHAALRKVLTPREALERAALQLQQPGSLPAAPETTSGVPESTEGTARMSGETSPTGGEGVPNTSPSTRPPANSPASPGTS